jgi:hypothetical protein
LHDCKTWLVESSFVERRSFSDLECSVAALYAQESPWGRASEYKGWPWLHLSQAPYSENALPLGLNLTNGGSKRIENL